MNFTSLAAWARQPTTVASAALVVAGATAALAHMFAANPYVTFGCGIVAAAMTLAGINDNSAAAKPVEKFIEDAARAYVNGRLTALLPVLLAEGPAALAAITAPAPIEALGVPAIIPVLVVGATT